MSEKSWIILGSSVLFLLFVAMIFRISCFGYVENYELGYTFDSVTGKTEPLLNKDGTCKNGFIYANPLVSVYTIDLRPMQVTINANNRVLNAKLVQFNPKGFKTFVSWHGNGNYNQESLKDILMSYAYDPINKSYDFLTIKKELKNEDTYETDTETNQNVKVTNKIISDTISK
jgi:hypothetical protein